VDDSKLHATIDSEESSYTPPQTFAEMTLLELAEVLSLTIKHDYENKLVTFLCMLSAYTQKNQMNVSFNAPSSSGKSYMTTEIAKLFPKDDKIELSGASPTSFFHGEGVTDTKRKAKIVSLSRKILIFYEQPDPVLQAKLRSVLSHDQWETKYRITNKGQKGEHRAQLIIIQGFPATVFCSAGMKLDEQEATRAILLSPEMTEGKLKEGVHLQAQRGADEVAFKAAINTEPTRIALKERIRAIRDEEVDDIIIPEPDVIEQRFFKKLSNVKPRHMRDMAHLMKLIKAIALLNIWSRKRGAGFYEASQSDIDQAFDLWGYFIESQDLNLPPALMNFYKNYILPAYQEKKDADYTGDMENGKVGISRNDLAHYYLKVEHTMLNDEQLRKQILPQLENSGLIMQQKPSEGDKRSWHIFPQCYPEENNIGKARGTTSPAEAREIIETANMLFKD
jgi:hypothetical protein